MPIHAKRQRSSASFTCATAIMAGMLFGIASPQVSYAQSPESETAAVESASPSAEQLAILKQLDDDDYMTRDLAMTALLTDDELSPQTLDQLYANATSDEQRVRLRQIVVHHTVRTLSLQYVTKADSAILGMSPAPLNNLPDDSNAAPAILVRWTFPGSVAFAHLRQGDIITQVNGRPIPAGPNAGQVTSTFIQLIANCRVGDPMSFHVIRDGHELDIHLKLGSDRALQAVYQRARTAQSREFNADVAQKIEDRLKMLDQLEPASEALKLTLPEPAAAPKEPEANAQSDGQPFDWRGSVGWNGGGVHFERVDIVH